MIQNWLKKTGKYQFNIYCLIAAFGVYFCMYAFRKPFAAASFEDKEILVVAQVIGYLISKFYGIKFISELKGQNRAYIILYLIGFSHLTLLVFAYLPDVLRPYNFFLMFLNGLPLGMIWGIVFSYLEGRRFTEILAAGLTVSFIIASGFVKSVGKLLLVEEMVSIFEMPFYTGLIFAPITILFVWLLSKIPPPNPNDILLRSERKPMNKDKRRVFFVEFFPGLAILIVSYMMFTAYRDIREAFANEIWIELGVTDPSIFTKTELPAGILIGLTMALFYRVKDNMTAFKLYHFMIVGGLGMVLFATMAFSAGLISAIWWMILIGIGGYLAYVTFACVLFDRLIAACRFEGNAGFMIYVVDAMGYLGSALIMLYKRYGSLNLNWYQFFLQSSFVISIGGILLVFISLFYFLWKIDSSDKVYTNTKPILT